MKILMSVIRGVPGAEFLYSCGQLSEFELISTSRVPHTLINSLSMYNNKCQEPRVLMIVQRDAQGGKDSFECHTGSARGCVFFFMWPDVRVTVSAHPHNLSKGFQVPCGLKYVKGVLELRPTNGSVS